MRPTAIATTLAALAAATLALPRAAHAQAPVDSAGSRTLLAAHHREASQADAAARTAVRPAASAERAPATTRPALSRRGPGNAGMYGLLLAGGVVYNAACPLNTLCDRDAGGYVDRYNSIDKVAHASTAASLTSFAIQGGVQPEAAAILTILGGIGFELTQTQGGGYYSGRDVVANSAGALVAWGWHRANFGRRLRDARDANDRR